LPKSQQYITHNTLKESDIDMPIEDQHVEHSAEDLAENYDEELAKQLDSSYTKGCDTEGSRCRCRSHKYEFRRPRN